MNNKFFKSYEGIRRLPAHIIRAQKEKLNIHDPRYPSISSIYKMCSILATTLSSRIGFGDKKCVSPQTHTSKSTAKIARGVLCAHGCGFSTALYNESSDKYEFRTRSWSINWISDIICAIFLHLVSAHKIQEPKNIVDRDNIPSKHLICMSVVYEPKELRIRKVQIRREAFCSVKSFSFDYTVRRFISHWCAVFRLYNFCHASLKITSWHTIYSWTHDSSVK